MMTRTSTHKPYGLSYITDSWIKLARKRTWAEETAAENLNTVSQTPHLVSPKYYPPFSANARRGPVAERRGLGDTALRIMRFLSR